MNSKKKIAISIGDLNGVGFEIALHSHNIVKELCDPIYCISSNMANEAAGLLSYEIPSDFTTYHIDGSFEILPGCVDSNSGKYSFESFKAAVKLCQSHRTDAVVTMPIHKESWANAQIEYVGHTDYLRSYFQEDAIMMLGCEKMYVALYTEHMALKDVAQNIEAEKLAKFLISLYKSIGKNKFAVLGLNPHAGDNGVLGNEEKQIVRAVEIANTYIGDHLFDGPLVPDIAFTPRMREKYRYFVAMYHDQGLAPLKALYFDESINVSLNLPIVRTSVDHGTAFDIAYKGEANNLSYLNAIKSAIELSSLQNIS